MRGAGGEMVAVLASLAAGCSLLGYESAHSRDAGVDPDAGAPDGALVGSGEAAVPDDARIDAASVLGGDASIDAGGADAGPDASVATCTNPDVCDFACMPNQQSCAFACAGTKNCHAHCATNAGCAFACSDSALCDYDCPPMSSCSFRCTRADECRVHCANDSICVTECEGSNCTKITCDALADCTLRCDELSTCAFMKCDKPLCTGGVQYCGGTHSCP